MIPALFFSKKASDTPLKMDEILVPTLRPRYGKVVNKSLSEKRVEFEDVILPLRVMKVPDLSPIVKHPSSS